MKIAKLSLRQRAKKLIHNHNITLEVDEYCELELTIEYTIERSRFVVISLLANGIDISEVLDKNPELETWCYRELTDLYDTDDPNEH